MTLRHDTADDVDATDDYVTEDECETRHKKLWWRAASILTMLGLLVALVVGMLCVSGFAWARSTDAVDRVSEVRQKFGEHQAAQVAATEALCKQLKRIEDGQDDNRKLLDQILRNGE